MFLEMIDTQAFFCYRDGWSYQSFRKTNLAYKNVRQIFSTKLGAIKIALEQIKGLVISDAANSYNAYQYVLQEG